MGGEDSLIALHKNLDKSRFTTNNDESYHDTTVPIYRINKITHHLDIEMPNKVNKF